MFYEDPRNHGLAYNPFKAIIAPRPIAWVSSQDTEGVLNLAPYSFFNAMAEFPPTIVFAPNNPRLGGGRKDTLANIEATNQFVVNLCHYDLKDQMNTSSAHVDPGVDEFALSGLTPASSVNVKPPRVKEALAALECEFMFRVRLPSTNPKAENNAVFGKVVGIHIDDSIIVDGRVKMERYRPLSRLGYMDYSVVDNVFAIDRPDQDLDSYDKTARKHSDKDK